MICFTLSCAKDHRFESWFASSGAYDVLQAAGQLRCPNCGDSTVTKALMAPAVAVKSTQTLDAPKSDTEKALAEIRRHIEENSDYVGLNFAAEARKIHTGDAPARAIYGEANAAETRALLEEGVPVAPLPFMPRAKVN